MNLKIVIIAFVTVVLTVAVVTTVIVISQKEKVFDKVNFLPGSYYL